MKKILLLVSAILLLSTQVDAQFSRGCLQEKRDTSLTHKRNFAKEILPSSFSLAKYAPPVLSQGNLSSCTCWSSAYAGLTIVKRIETGNMYHEPFSPLSLYNRLKAMDSEDPCHAGGCYVSTALTLLEDHGCPKFQEVDNSCGYASASNYFNDKLFNFEEISVKASDIKSALTKKSPVVMVIQYYNNGWGEKDNLPNGIWNGNYGTPDGYHAMCIVGYDDNVAGGAFLVMNSWGDDWGKDGFFWLKYKDLTPHVDQTFMLIPDPKKINNDNNNNNNNNNNTNNNTDNNNNNTDNNSNDNNYDDQANSEGQVFRVYNECSVTAYVALAQYNDAAWVSRGWYAAQPGEYIDLAIGERETDDIYWMATNNSNNLIWKDGENGTDICYDPTDAFTIYDNANPSCPKYTKFFKANPGYENLIYTQTLTCPSLKSRGDKSVVLSADISEGKVDKRSADVANYNWEKGFLLFDLFNRDIIHPSSNGSYTVWYIGADNKIKQSTFSADELANLRAYKFESKENAEHWMASGK